MAKRKTPKKDKVVDLKPKAEKVTTEQLQELQTVVKAINQGQRELGMIETQKHNILHEVMQLQGMVQNLQQKFKEEYGSVDVNIADGTIKYEENEQVNS